ncbi:MAG: SpaH/EbpB family LPXTG-anchored major pilin, partial [Streptococcus minor]|nr:SpaH/EbpB family LPXTG-anchored major pilin [Streptococcus minor]
KTIYNSPSEVVITYSAVVTKEAKDGQATNSATIGYNTSDTPNVTPTPVNPQSPDDNRTTVTTHRFTLKKTNDARETLTGAEFKLYDAANNGTEIKVVKDGNEYRVAEAGEEGAIIEAGEVVIKGLKGGTTYYLEEIKAPNGYNVLTERKAVTVSEDNNARADVINKKGAVLPNTGAIGTTLFYLIGSILLLVALVYTISKRRMNSI